MSEMHDGTSPAGRRAYLDRLGGAEPEPDDWLAGISAAERMAWQTRSDRDDAERELRLVISDVAPHASGRSVAEMAADAAAMATGRHLSPPARNAYARMLQLMTTWEMTVRADDAASSRLARLLASYDEILAECHRPPGRAGGIQEVLSGDDYDEIPYIDAGTSRTGGVMDVRGVDDRPSRRPHGW